MKFSLTYIRYIGSPEWKRRRLRALKLAGFRCQVCHSPERLEVHHNNYARLGHEADSDLIVLCHGCHRVVTVWIRFKRWMKWK